MPDADQPVALGPDHDRRFLPADGSPVERGQVVRSHLQRVEEVVEVLDVADRPEATHRGADGLAEDRRLADAGIGQAQVAVLRLQALEHEVHVAKPAYVLADDEDARIARKVGVEVAKQDHAAVDSWRLVRVNRSHHRHLEGRVRRPAVQERVVSRVVFAPVPVDKSRQLRALGRVDAARLVQGARRARHDQRPRHLVRLIEGVRDLSDLGHVDPPKDADRCVAFGSDWRLDLSEFSWR